MDDAERKLRTFTLDRDYHAFDIDAGGHLWLYDAEFDDDEVMVNGWVSHGKRWHGWWHYRRVKGERFKYKFVGPAGDDLPTSPG